MTALDMADIIQSSLDAGAELISFDRAQAEELAEWLRQMEEGYLAYRRLGGEDIDEMED